MRVREPIGIVAAKTLIPEKRCESSQAVVDHQVRPELPLWEGYEEYGVCEGPLVESMAAPAAARILEEHGWEPDQLRLILYASALDSSSAAAAPNAQNDGVMPQARLARLIGARNAMAIGIGQSSNGGASALEVGVSMMLAEPKYGKVMVATADSFNGWQSGEGGRWVGAAAGLLGDGSTVALLSRDGGPLAIRSFASSSIAEMEDHLTRFGCVKGLGDRSIEHEVIAEMLQNIHRCVTEAVTEALRQAGLEADDPSITAVTLPRVGRSAQRLMFLPPLPPELPEPLFLGAKTGHLGAGDQLANVADLLGDGPLRPGEYAVMISGGGVFTVSCMVVQRR
jgi:3-oxoacyl-[acyl-carrier-protein] synthase-3